MKKIQIIAALLLIIGVRNAQAQQTVLKPDTHTTADELQNHKRLHDMMRADAAQPAAKILKPQALNFPLRIGVVTNPENPQYPTQAQLNKTIARLNKGFYKAAIHFTIVQIDTIFSDYTLENLSDDAYLPYRDFSKQVDLKDTLSLFLFDYNPNFCRSTGESITCGRQAGFSYILSQETNNVVMSKFDLEDYKVVAHEFGHFFGLYHTFEEKFGRELPSGDNCETTGDLICDTPADPGSVYEVYVNSSDCEMLNNRDEATQKYYKPLISNYMAYYKPCYMQEYSFTNQQNRALFLASRSNLRRHFASVVVEPTVAPATTPAPAVTPMRAPTPASAVTGERDK